MGNLHFYILKIVKNITDCKIKYLYIHFVFFLFTSVARLNQTLSFYVFVYGTNPIIACPTGRCFKECSFLFLKNSFIFHMVQYSSHIFVWPEMTSIPLRSLVLPPQYDSHCISKCVPSDFVILCII